MHLLRWRGKEDEAMRRVLMVALLTALIVAATAIPALAAAIRPPVASEGEAMPTGQPCAATSQDGSSSEFEWRKGGKVCWRLLP
jgi:hypothetical protein